MSRQEAGGGSSPAIRYAWVIVAVVLLASVAASLNQFKVPPLIPVLMAAFGLDLSQAGALMSVFALAGLVLALPAGFILQRLGPKLAGGIAVGSLGVGGRVASGLVDRGRFRSGRPGSLLAVRAPARIA